jgi:hypothetical protein
MKPQSRKKRSEMTELEKLLDRDAGNLYTRKEFTEYVEDGSFMDDDGGYDAFRADGSQWYPEGVDPTKEFFFGFGCSDIYDLPEEVTQILWYNK